MEHFYGTHSAPWFLAEALRKSQYYTPDLDAADVVFVYDYCYYITWLGFVHEKGRDIQETPGDDLLAACAPAVSLYACSLSLIFLHFRHITVTARYRLCIL